MSFLNRPFGEFAVSDLGQGTRSTVEECIETYSTKPSPTVTQSYAPAVDFYKSSNLALTYANNRYIDGAGAQLQRIYSIYALSRFLDISYVHSPLQEIGYYGLSALERNEAMPEMTARYNEIFTIKSTVELPKKVIIHNMVRTNLDFLCTMKDQLKRSDEFHLVRMVFPDPLINHHLQALRYIKDVSPFERPNTPLFRIALHVRRGDLFVAESERMLPNSYYIDIALQAVAIAKELNIPFCCDLYTELPSKTFVVTPDHQGLRNFVITQNRNDIGNRIDESVTVNPEESCIEEFEVLPNLKKWINHDPIESMAALATADLLIISRSCFSYVPALLNKKGTVVYFPFWHGPLSGWINGDHPETLHNRLREAFEHWKAENSRAC